MEYEESDVPLVDPPTQRGKTITPEVVFGFCFAARPLVQANSKQGCCRITLISFLRAFLQNPSMLLTDLCPPTPTCP